MLTVDQVNKIIDDLYQGVKGTLVSYSERQRKEIESSVFVYGEAELNTLNKILDIIDPKEGEIFYDLGSGVGKQVLSAGLLKPFGKVCGIEFLEDLHRLSEEKLDEFNSAVLPTLPDGTSLPTIEFKRSDFFEYDLTEADVVYACSTCFDDEMMEKIAKIAEGLKPGARIVTLTKPLYSDELEEISRDVMPMSWGTSHVFIYRRK